MTTADRSLEGLTARLIASTDAALRDRELAAQNGFTMDGVKKPDTSRNFSRKGRRYSRRKALR